MIGLIVGLTLGILSGRIIYRIADFFIAPREKWRKSKWDILLLKLGMAISVGVYVTFFIASLLEG